MDWPAGLGAQIVREKCLRCHPADLIRQQRLTRIGWERETDKMIRWGATLTDGEREPVVDYLASNFGPLPLKAVPTDASTGPGADVFNRRCLACHDIDIVAQQRLDTAGWAREVDKMIRWGAAVNDSDRESLIAYLTRAFGPRPSRRLSP